MSTTTNRNNNAYWRLEEMRANKISLFT